jgi:hypothetical protein
MKSLKKAYVVKKILRIRVIIDIQHEISQPVITTESLAL